MKALQIIESAFRGTLEEQDDTIVWLTHCIHDAGGELSVLLTGNAVAYAVEGQDASGIKFGEWTQTHPPRIDQDLAKLVEKGVGVYAVADDVQRRGLGDVKLVDGIELIGQGEVAELCAAHDQIWHW